MKWPKLLLLLLFCSFQDAEWADPKYKAANTAASAAWQTPDEKQIFFYVNLARMFPKEFAEKYVKPHIKNSGYHRSLYDTMVKLKPRTALAPDQTLFNFADCFAKEAGKKGYVGHQRKKCANGGFAECCSYGADSPLAVVMQLLVDDKIPSLGHRKILLDPYYSKMGVATREHKSYGTNTVLDIQ
ncbi:MAG: CAP domain-containing protein [Bacteroidia bacterium]|nr:CAP domain-containing protein [Bacteroidia bacterium]